MADEEQLGILHEGVEAWNDWRWQNPDVDVDLTRADLSGADLYKANLARADLSRAWLTAANFSEADLSRARLPEAHLVGANLSWTNLSQTNLSDANLVNANLTGAELSGANLMGANASWADISKAQVIEADLSYSNLVGTNFTGADLTRCRVYGISAWNLKLDGAKQANLIITGPTEPEITVDNIEIAQFIYLLLNNEKIRNFIDTMTTKAVLILGRFTPERKPVLESLREELRNRDYLPVLFDFDKPASRSTLETVSTLAHMARFVIADLTDAKSVLQELQEIVPRNPSVPVQPLILATQEEPGMFDFFCRYPGCCSRTATLIPRDRSTPSRTASSLLPS